MTHIMVILMFKAITINAVEVMEVICILVWLLWLSVILFRLHGNAILPNKNVLKSKRKRDNDRKFNTLSHWLYFYNLVPAF